jgi:3-deoxy-manno-octulosonate cytidylyltransferase (CMP-KDO synthetase)
MPERTKVSVIIPARFGSSRFPGKPLVPLMGKPLIQHVYERAAGAAGVGTVLVATDDKRIRDAVEAFGGRAVLTTDPFRCGTDRVAAVARELPGDIFLDVQADEIMLDPALLSDLIVPFLDSTVGMGTLKRTLTQAADLHNPAVVKVVTNESGDALYFSRAAIPHVRDQEPGSGETRGHEGLHYMHLGVYIYRRATLMQFTALPTGRLEEAEKLEQLRALEHGIRIRVWQTEHASLRIDTTQDLKDAEAALLRLDAVCRRI